MNVGNEEFGNRQMMSSLTVLSANAPSVVPKALLAILFLEVAGRWWGLFARACSRQVSASRTSDAATKQPPGKLEQSPERRAARTLPQPVSQALASRCMMNSNMQMQNNL